MKYALLSLFVVFLIGCSPKNSESIPPTSPDHKQEQNANIDQGAVSRYDVEIFPDINQKINYLGTAVDDSGELVVYSVASSGEIRNPSVLLKNLKSSTTSVLPIDYYKNSIFKFSHKSDHLFSAVFVKPMIPSGPSRISILDIDLGTWETERNDIEVPNSFKEIKDIYISRNDEDVLIFWRDYETGMMVSYYSLKLKKELYRGVLRDLLGNEKECFRGPLQVNFQNQSNISILFSTGDGCKWDVPTNTDFQVATLSLGVNGLKVNQTQDIWKFERPYWLAIDPDMNPYILEYDATGMAVKFIVGGAIDKKEKFVLFENGKNVKEIVLPDRMTISTGIPSQSFDEGETLTFVETDCINEAGTTGYCLGLISLNFKKGSFHLIKTAPLRYGASLSRPYGIEKYLNLSLNKKTLFYQTFLEFDLFKKL